MSWKWTTNCCSLSSPWPCGRRRSPRRPLRRWRNWARCSWRWRWCAGWTCRHSWPARRRARWRCPSCGSPDPRLQHTQTKKVRGRTDNWPARSKGIIIFYSHSIAAPLINGNWIRRRPTSCDRARTMKYLCCWHRACVRNSVHKRFQLAIERVIFL